jgi:hypothetical protein
LHLKGKLKNNGFTQSENDPCLFMNDKVICIVYAEDTLLYYTNEIFLGILITKKPDGTLNLTQTCLIQRILAALHMDDFSTKETLRNMAVCQLIRMEIRRKELTAIQA